MNNVNLFDTTFVVIDLETSGGSPKAGAGITEVGAVKVRGGQIIGEFATFVNPESPIPAFITELTGITEDMVYQAPLIQDLLPTLFEFRGSNSESVLVAHNAPFDLSFLKSSAEKYSYEWPEYVVIDTVKYARKVFAKDEVGNYRLGTLTNFLGTKTLPTHRALDDARATVEVLHAIIERFGDLGINTLGELLTHQRKSATARKSLESK